ncbi:MAG: diguanylate cyclase [Propionivibrio sp.]
MQLSNRAPSPKNTEAMHARLLLDSVPLACTFWSARGELVDCNLEAPRLFGLGSKQDYLDHFFELSPERQPSGRLSRESALEYVNTAIREGSVRFEWMHRKLDGEPIPAEITLVRVPHGERNLVVGHMRDLREEKKLEAETREADERTQIMFDTTPLGCTFWDEEARLVACNQEAARFFGFSSKREFMERFYELTPERQPDGRLSTEALAENTRRAIAEGYQRFEWMHQMLDGEPVPTEITLVRVQLGRYHGVAAYMRDLREYLKCIRQIQEANEYTQLMLDATPLGCNLWSETHENIACNQEVVNLFDLDDKQEYLDHFFELSPEYQPSGKRSSEAAQEHIGKAFREGHTRFEWMHQKLNGDPVPAEITLVRVRRGDSYIVAGYTRDLRELKETVNSLKQLEKLAYTDKLTGVANRRYFLEEAVARLGHLSPGGSASLLIFDIDHFKRVNDTHGHTAGDVILQGVAERIQQTLRPDDLFARYGGEEFVILLVRAGLDATLAFADRVRENVAQTPFTYQDKVISTTISVGVTTCRYPAEALPDLIDRADAALYRAKDNGRNRVELILPGD